MQAPLAEVPRPRDFYSHGAQKMQTFQAALSSTPSLKGFKENPHQELDLQRGNERPVRL